MRWTGLQQHVYVCHCNAEFEIGVGLNKGGYRREGRNGTMNNIKKQRSEKLNQILQSHNRGSYEELKWSSAKQTSKWWQGMYWSHWFVHWICTPYTKSGMSWKEVPRKKNYDWKPDWNTDKTLCGNNIVKIPLLNPQESNCNHCAFKKKCYCQT